MAKYRVLRQIEHNVPTGGKICLPGEEIDLTDAEAGEMTLGQIIPLDRTPLQPQATPTQPEQPSESAASPAQVPAAGP